MKNPHIRGLGEAVLRVKNLEVMKDFYARALGLELMKEFGGIAFFKIADGYGGHTQILGMFEESQPLPIRLPTRTAVNPLATPLHHFAIEIDKAHYDQELTRLTRLGLSVTTAVHPWCHWRSIYVLDPEEKRSHSPQRPSRRWARPFAPLIINSPLAQRRRGGRSAVERFLHD